jgi:hypothetical protein
VPGANYAISTGTYNLTFYKHVSGSNTFVNALSINGASSSGSTPSVTVANSLGIGTTTPNTFVSIINSNGNAANGYSGNVDDIGMLQVYNSGVNSSGASITVRNYYGTSQLFQWFSNGARIGSRVTGSAGSGNLYLTYGADQVGLFITGSNGNVGIGTTSPSEILDVYRAHPGSAAWSARSVTRDASYAAFTGVYWNGTASIPAVAAHVSALNAWAPLYVNTIDGTGNNGGNVIMGGFVGIGTSSPGSLLTLYATTTPTIAFQNAGGIRGYISADSGNNYYNAVTGNGHAFQTNGTTTVSITSAGTIIPEAYLNLTDVVSQSDTTDTWPVLGFSGANGTGGVTKTAGTYDWGVIKGGTTRGYYGRVVGAFHASSTIDQGFYTSGWTAQFVVNGSNGNAYLRGTLTQGSDARIKANVTDLNYGLAEVMQLRAVSYNKKVFNKDEDGIILSESIDTENKYIGFIAQEVKPIIPEVVNGDENSENPERGLSIEYQNITALLVKALQELNTKFEDYKATHP